jgi:hypothetical protein
VILGFLLWAHLQFGSLRLARLYALGVPLLVEPNPVDPRPSEIPGTLVANVRVVNLTRVPIRVLGVSASCNCLATEGLPLAIPALDSRPLRVLIRTDASASESVEQTILYHTDAAAIPRFSVSITGRPTSPRPPR